MSPWISFKCYFRLKMLTSNNVVFETQIKDFAISWKSHVWLLKCLVFHILNLSINFLIKGSWVFWGSLIPLTLLEVLPIGSSILKGSWVTRPLCRTLGPKKSYEGHKSLVLSIESWVLIWYLVLEHHFPAFQWKVFNNVHSSDIH